MSGAILDWQKKHPDSKTRVPDSLEGSLGEIRAATSELIHGSGKLTDEEVKVLVGKIETLTSEIKAKATAQAGPKNN